MPRTFSSMILLPFCVSAILVACGGDDGGAVPGDNTPYTSDPDKTVVVGGATASTASGGASGTAQPSAGCVTLPSGECVDAKSCAPGERRDVVVDSKGSVVAVVCYPANATPPEVNSEGDVSLNKTENNGVVAIDGAADGVDIKGNVVASGNNVVVYGEGPAVSVIGGNVDSGGNNFSLRGVTVKGTVHVVGNNATLVLCSIEGNVVFDGNNNVIANCSILGNVEIKGVNNTIVSNQIGGQVSVGTDKNTVCDGNVVWTDANANKVFDTGEAGAAITCGGNTGTAVTPGKK